MASSNARVVVSTRGGHVLEWNGYRYYKRSVNRSQTVIYWRCTERDYCNATCKTNFNISSGIIVTPGITHTHEQETVEIRVQEVMRNIKRRAENHPNAPPTAIFRAEVSQLNSQVEEEVIMNLPQRSDIIRNINRIQNRNRPLNVNSLQDLIIQAPYDRTLNGDLFFQFDSGVDANGDRFLLFYTIRDLERMCASRVILCDGTFKTVPSFFYQLYSIHGNVYGHTFPLVYCLSTRKTENFYRNMLTQLVQHATEHNFAFNPQIIISDFELAFLNAAKDLFPNANVKGCLFHYTQAIWKMAVQKKFSTQHHMTQ